MRYNQTMKRFVGLLVVGLVASVLLGGVLRAWAQGEGPSGEGERYFEQTGHYVSGPFLRRFEATPDAVLLFGYPITEAFRQPDGSYWQYFQKAVMRWAPDASEVALLPLGEMFYRLDRARAQEPSFAASGPGCTVYKPNTPAVCFAFRAAYERFGGPNVLGDPVSSLVVVDGWLVQYFTLARMEYHPEAPPNHQVQFSPLGERWFYLQQEDPALLLPQRDAIMQRSPLRLRVRAFVAVPVLLAGQEQHLYVTVTDGIGEAIPQATVSLAFARPDAEAPEDGWSQSSVTSEQGVCVFRLGWEALASTAKGQPWIRVYVRAQRGGLQPVVGSTYVDFRVWQWREP